MAEQWEDSGAEKKPSHLRRFIGVILLLVFGGIFLLIKFDVIPIKYVLTGSMEPTLQIGDRVMIDSTGFPDRFDICAFRDPSGETNDWYIKRVVGIPGDVVEIRGGILYINGALQYSEKISGNRINWEDIRQKVPSATVFVLGDNRNDSFDSLNFGPIPEDKVMGVASRIVWPSSRWGKIPRFRDAP